ncbi:sigma factor-like helix-turn-helix DNA-binding protein [Chloroflexota bacterium]
MRFSYGGLPPSDAETHIEYTKMKMKDILAGQPKAQVSRLRRIGGLRFLYNRQIYQRGEFYDDEADEPPQGFTDNLPGVLETLRERERLVLTLRYLDGQPRSLTQVARIMGVTKERIRQIEVRALQKLMHPTKRQALGIAIEKKSRYFRRDIGNMMGLGLIDVLIIIAILGILAAIILPSLLRLRGG